MAEEEGEWEDCSNSGSGEWEDDVDDSDTPTDDDADEDEDDGEWEDVEDEDERPNVYRDDLVRLVGVRDKVGMVLNVAGGIAEDEQDEHELESLPDGYALVQWLNRCDPRAENLKSLEVVDRMFMPSDTVARISDPFTGMKGTVIDLDIVCDVKSVAEGKVRRDRTLPPKHSSVHTHLCSYVSHPRYPRLARTGVPRCVEPAAAPHPPVRARSAGSAQTRAHTRAHVLAARARNKRLR